MSRQCSQSHENNVSDHSSPHSKVPPPPQLVGARVSYSANVIQHHAFLMGVPATRSNEIIDCATSQLLVAFQDSVDFHSHDDIMRVASCWIAARDLKVKLPFDLRFLATYINKSLENLEAAVNQLDIILAQKTAESEQWLKIQRDDNDWGGRRRIDTWTGDEMPVPSYESGHVTELDDETKGDEEAEEGLENMSL